MSIEITIKDNNNYKFFRKGRWYMKNKEQKEIFVPRGYGVRRYFRCGRRWLWLRRTCLVWGGKFSIWVILEKQPMKNLLPKERY